MRRQYECQFTYYTRKAIEANPELNRIYGSMGRFNHWKITNLNLKMNLNECCLQCGSCAGCECSN